MAKKKNLFTTWKHKYRVTVFKDNTLQEVWKIRLTKLDIFTIIVSAVLFLIISVTILISFTSLREFIPGYPDGNQRKQIIKNALTVDSLKSELTVRDRYFDNIRKIVSGEEPDNLESVQDTILSTENISFSKSVEDSLLRHQIEKEEQYNLTVNNNGVEESNIARHFFFTPLKGMISGPFDPVKNHFGVDIVGSPGSVIHATLDGSVTMASWTLDTGYVIQIQHEDNLISVYRHNAELLKKVGDHVRAGESIAILGNSGEMYTSGPHLHFELWHEGRSLDPEKFVVF